MDLHSSNSYSRVSNIPVWCLVGDLAHRDQEYQLLPLCSIIPSGPQQEKERGSHRGVFRDQSWEVYSTPPLSTSTTQSSGHVSTPSCKGTCPGLRGTGVCEYIVVFCLPFTRGSALPLTPAQQQALLPYIGFDFFTISSEENILS